VTTDSRPDPRCIDHRAGGSGLRALSECQPAGIWRRCVCKSRGVLSSAAPAHTVMAEGGIAGRHGQCRFRDDGVPLSRHPCAAASCQQMAACSDALHARQPPERSGNWKTNVGESFDRIRRRTMKCNGVWRTNHSRVKRVPARGVRTGLERYSTNAVEGARLMQLRGLLCVRRIHECTISRM